MCLIKGTYFLKNKQVGYYADIEGPTMADGTEIHQWTFNGNNSQKWIFEHQGDGFYTIRSGNSTADYYLGVFNDDSTVNTDIVLRDGDVTLGMLWNVSKTSSGAFKITAKKGYALNYALATTTSNSTNGAKLIHGEYVYNDSYRDEWEIISYDNAILLAIDDVDQAKRNSYFSETKNHLQTIRNNTMSVVSTITYTSCTTNDMKNYLQSNNVFIIHTHGNSTGFKIGQGSYIDIYDLYGVDLSNLDFVLLLTCYAGDGYDLSNITNNTPQNMVEQLVVCGARTVVGFNNKTKVSDCNMFAPALISIMITSGASVQDAVDLIDYSGYINDMKKLCVIAGDPHNNLH